MAIVATDLKMYFSGSGTGPTSLGGAIHANLVTDNSLNNVWDDVSGDEASVGDVEYRCIYVKNTHGTLTLTNSKLWILSNTTGGDSVKVGLDLVGLNGTADTVATENDAPSPAVTFVTAVDKANGLNVGSVPAGQYYAIWIERTVGASTGVFDNSTYQLKWEGDTSA